MTRAKNLFEYLPRIADQEQFLTLIKAANIRLERIVSYGHHSPKNFWYDQELNEWVILLKGNAGIQFEGEDTVLNLQPGDYINIPAHRKHRVEWTSPKEPTIWLAVHY